MAVDGTKVSYSWSASDEVSYFGVGSFLYALEGLVLQYQNFSKVDTTLY